jgi:hypothetical protein
VSDDEHGERDEATEREKNFSRRALLQAGFAAPIVYAVARRLPGAHPQVRPTQTHTDTAHQDSPHVDSVHADHAHSDVAHVDAHLDNNLPPPDPAHSDLHIDSPHVDSAHADSAHADSAHADVAHGDSTTHADTAHADHTDVPSAPAAGAVSARPRFTG